MKNRYIKTITYTGLLAVLALQLIWAYNVYSFSKEELQRKGGEIFRTAVSSELDHRFQTVTIPKGAFGDLEDGSSVTYAFFNEVFESVGAPLSIEFVDSTYKSLAAKENLNTNIVIEHISDSLGVIQSTQKEKGFWYLTCSKKYTKEDESEYLQVFILSPFKDIFTPMSLLLMGTIIFVFLIIYCITYQIKIINRQSKIAQLRNNFTHAMVHNMKIPLTSIKIGNKAIESGKLSPEKTKQNHEIVNRETESILKFAESTLTLAQKEQDEPTLNKEAVNKYIKTITSIGLLAVLALQLIWTFNTYNFIKEETQRKGADLLDTALGEDVTQRIRTVPLPKEGAFDDLEDGSSVGYAILNEVYESLSAPLSLHYIDSTYKSLAAEEGLSTNIVIEHISDSLGIIQSTQKEKGFWHLTCPEKVYTKENESEYLQVSILNPHKDIFTQMGLLLIGTIIFVFLIIYCITYQIKIINRQNKIAQLRNDFTHAMVHNMKTPLTSIKIGNKAIESGKLSPEKTKRNHEIINEEVENILMLTEKILTLAQIEQDELTLNKEIVSVKAIVDDLMEKFLAKAKKEINFVATYNIEEVYADAGYLKQVISNLIENAIKYSGDKVTITVTVDRNNDYTLIKVKDNGFGISAKDQLKIFEKFERGAASKRSAKGGAAGFGIGLNYVQQVVRMHGGMVAIESVKGEYSEFTIKLPKLIEEI
ncbi:ATP-binding protein [Bacteroides sp. 519]|uniref:ATP-binding protein n=1 Tax=Bacteroides sp. 519 TaxID=2302937 RepID=UPI0013D78702|nr:ATP-binding protein [Bacteroides sp. 519]